MTGATTPERARRLVPEPASRVQAALAVAAAAAFVVFLAVHAGGDTTPQLPAFLPGDFTTGTVVPSRPTAVSAAALAGLAAKGGQPIYWIGPRNGVTYEVKRTAAGNVFLRYLPPGVPVGARQLALTVGTYPVRNAFARTGKSASGPGAVQVPVGGGVAYYRRAKPSSVYVAFPLHAYQIEVFSPDAAQARRLVTAGEVRPVPGSPTAPTLEPGVPTAVSVADLRAFSASIGQPIYWIGPRAGTTYELTQNGANLFLRYLPKGVAIGDRTPELTIGTYRLADAYETTAALAARQDARKVDIGIAGVGFYRLANPYSVFLASPGRDIQVEVFAHPAAEALRLATGGQVRPVG